MSDSITFEEDDYIRRLQEERATALWVAHLSDGRAVFMDDGRPGCEPASAWERLRLRVAADRLRLVGISLKFRDHFLRQVVGEADAYFFCKQITAVVGGGEAVANYNLGYQTLTKGLFLVQSYIVPALLHVETAQRQIGLESPCVIENASRD